MHRDRHVGRPVRDRRVDHVGINPRQFLRIVATFLQHLALFRVAQVGQIGLVQLKITAANIGERSDRFPVGDAEIPEAGYSFGKLIAAQAAGDLQTLRGHGLPAERVKLDGEPAAAVRALGDRINGLLG